MEDLGKSIPAAESMIDAEQGAGSTRNEFCLNCGTKLQDVFCHHCGQKDIPRRQTLRELWTNFISSFWSYEGKFFQTTKFLITKPGFLAIEYNAGRRESYYHPARMYVFISFVFFLLFVSFSDTDSDNKGEMKMDKEDYLEFRKDYPGTKVDSILASASVWTKDSSEVKIPLSLVDSIRKVSSTRKGKKKNSTGFSLTGTGYKSEAAYDSAQKLLPENKRDSWIERKLTIRGIELNEKYKDDMGQFGKDFVKLFMDNFSKVLFWLLPFFALLLKLLYVRRDFYYSEHLVFSIYYYNFFFLAGSLQILTNVVPWLDWLSTVIGFWIYFYLLFGMKRMYQQSWRKTILKFGLFNIGFFILLVLGFGISALAIIMVI